MVKNNLHNRIKNARFIGREARFKRRSLESNPFAKYDGVEGDGVLISQAFEDGWNQADKDLPNVKFSPARTDCN